MKVYIRKNKQGEFFNSNMYSAYYGFNELGAEIIPYEDIKLLNTNPEDIIVDGILQTRYIFNKFNCSYPNLEYPQEIAINKFLKRKIWQDTLGNIMANKEKWNVFIKPVVGGKLFTGTAIKSFKDFRYCVGADTDTKVWCSELVDFTSEYRCFIRYGNILDIKHYHGDPFMVPSKKFIQDIINEYKSAPNAYTIDIGIDKNGEEYLIEVNEGYSVGSYGLDHIKYAKFLATRWAQITNTEDEYKYF